MRKLILTLALIGSVTLPVNAQQSMSKAQAAAVLLVGAGYCHSTFQMFTNEELGRFTVNATEWLIKNGVEPEEFRAAVEWARTLVIDQPPDADGCASIGTTLNE